MITTATRPDLELSELLDGIRTAVAARADHTATAQLVAEQLRCHLPSPDVLTAEERLGSADGYRSHTLHVEPDGSFAVVALVWRPGQVTRIHDHLTWCVFGVIQGVEHEELFDRELHLIGQADNFAGDVNGFAPPATSTASATSATPRPSRSTSTALTSRTRARVSGATTTEPTSRPAADGASTLPRRRRDATTPRRRRERRALSPTLAQGTAHLDRDDANAGNAL